jgi:hypothetical protein
MTVYHDSGRTDGTRSAEQLTMSVEAMSTHDWTLVLLAPRSKRPSGKRWRLTQDSGVAVQHVRQGGNLGLLCGPRSGIAVLDPDRAAWADMVEALGQPVHPWVETGSGKLHYYVTWQSGLPAKLTWGGAAIGEIQRGPGLQQVVLPPSEHPGTGRMYRWLVSPAVSPLQPLPPSWVEHLTLQTNLHRVTGTPGYVNAAAFSDRLAKALSQPGARFRKHSGQVKFQCAACRAEGRDRHADNGVYFLNSGRWGCAVGGRRHWRRLAEVLGVLPERSA